MAISDAAGPTAAAKPLRLRRGLLQAPLHLVLIVTSVAVLLPFGWLLLGSFKTYSDLINRPSELPAPWTLDNYAQILAIPGFLNAFLNSCLVALARTITGCGTALVLGYIFSKYRFFGRDVLFIALLSTMLVPFPAIMVALYLTLSDLNLLNQVHSMIVIAIYSTIGTLLLRQWISRLPNELIEAARLDGAGELRIIFTIIGPMSAPPLAALAVYTFLTSWDEYMFPAIVLTEPSVKTLPLALASLKSLFWERYELYCAGAMVTVVPVMLLYASMQKQFIKGMTFMGGVKG